MQVAEKFLSINGEGQRAGELAVFIRFKGCNLSCSYCDTSWANESDCPFKEESPEEIYDYIKSSKIKNVTLTGGEPLLQKDMKKLLEILLKDEALRVEIETNGSLDLKPFDELRKSLNKENSLSFTMDYKLPSSDCEEKMNLQNFSVLKRNDTVKFVSDSKEDLEKALKIIKKLSLSERVSIFFSPVFGKIDPKEIVDFILENKLNDVKLQIQMHKIIWDPEMRGV